MKWWPNYTSNKALIIIGGFIAIYIFFFIILTCYDNKYFQQESLLKFLKQEIIRVSLTYEKEKEKHINKLVPTGFNSGIKLLNIFGNKGGLDDDLFMTNDKLELNLDEKTKKDHIKINKYGNDDENNEEKTIK